MILKITNANIVKDTTIECGMLLAEDGTITYVGTEREAYADVCYDAEGNYLLPGFIDIHTHGGCGYDFMDANPEEMRLAAKFHLSHGTTTLVVTTLTDSWDNIEAALDSFAALGDDRVTMHGVHLEGPWFSPAQCGAQSTDQMDTPSIDRLKELILRYPFIERVSLAPEIDEGFAVGRYASEHGVTVALGHTDADFDTTIEAAKNGYTLATHLYSGMKGVTRVNSYRVAGAVEAGLYDDSITAEVIADGKHLPEGLLKLIYKCKGADRICLITDSMRGAGMPEGSEVLLGRKSQNNLAIIEDGVAKLPDRTAFAGSVATTDRLFKTFSKLVGAPITEVSKMLSATPARVMGYKDRGRIEVGLLADLVVMDRELNVKKVFLKGEMI
jgi:N-acetylglucosamine-6-phosphate deacetylase